MFCRVVHYSSLGMSSLVLVKVLHVSWLLWGPSGGAVSSYISCVYTRGMPACVRANWHARVCACVRVLPADAYLHPFKCCIAISGQSCTEVFRVMPCGVRVCDAAFLVQNPVMERGAMVEQANRIDWSFKGFQAL